MPKVLGFVWRLVLSDPQVATLQEIETHYSVDDILLANEALDLKAKVEREARERAGLKG